MYQHVPSGAQHPRHHTEERATTSRPLQAHLPSLEPVPAALRESTHVYSLETLDAPHVRAGAAHHLESLAAFGERLSAAASVAEVTSLVLHELPHLLALPAAQVELTVTTTNPTAHEMAQREHQEAVERATSDSRAVGERAAGLLAFHPERTSHHECTIPLGVGTEQLGTLKVVCSRQSRHLTSDDETMLRVVGQLLSQVLLGHRTRARLEAAPVATPVAAPALRETQWDAFLARVTHEIRTPLTCISGHAQLMQRHLNAARTGATGALTPDVAARVIEEGERHLPAIRRQVLHIERLMSGMLDLAQSECGALVVVPTRFDLTACVRSALTAVDVPASYHVTFDAPDSLWQVGDARRIEQVVYDMLHYAIRAGRVGDRLHLRLARSRSAGQPRVLLTVQMVPASTAAHQPSRISAAWLKGLRDCEVARIEHMDSAHSFTAVGLVLGGAIAQAHGGHLYHRQSDCLLALVLPVGRPGVHATQ